MPYEILRAGDVNLSIHDKYSKLNTFSGRFILGTIWVVKGPVSNYISMVRCCGKVMECR